MIYSFSRLSAWETCKYAWWLNYIAKIFECPDCGQRFADKEIHPCPYCGGTEVKEISLNKENAFSSYGSFCHELLEKYAKGELASFELLDEYLDGFDIAVTEEFPPNAYANLYDSYFGSGADYFRNFEGFDYITSPYEVVGVEQEFETDFGAFKLKGFIDLLLRDGNGNYIIVDHKSKKEIKTKADKLHYGRQTALYAKYVFDTYGKWPTELVYNTFRSQSLCSIKFTKAIYDEAVEWATKQVEEIEAAMSDESFVWAPDLSSDFFCNYLCNFKDFCQFKNNEVK